MRVTRRRLLTLAHEFDRMATGPAGSNGEERALKARLARRRRGGRLYLTRADLVWLAEWKSARIRPRIARNTEAGVRGLSAAAFLCADERRRVRLLQALPGVGLAVASVILHFADPDRYPVYDVRVRAALRRLGVRRRFPPTPAGWVAYVESLGRLAQRQRLSLRTVDKALWLLGGAERGTGHGRAAAGASASRGSGGRPRQPLC